TDGLAPGWKISLNYHMLDLYSESEYLFDAHDSSGDFYYNWSEAGLSPREWLRFGFVAQRTKAYETDLDVQRGLFAAVTIRSVTLSTYVLNLGWETPTVVFAASASF